MLRRARASGRPQRRGELQRRGVRRQPSPTAARCCGGSRAVGRRARAASVPAAPRPQQRAGRYVCGVRARIAWIAAVAAVVASSGALRLGAHAAPLQRTHDLLRQPHRRRRSAPYSPLRRWGEDGGLYWARAPLEGKGLPRPPPLAAVLRPAVGLPARRRGVAGARRGARHPRLAVSAPRAPQEALEPLSTEAHPAGYCSRQRLRNRGRRHARLALSIVTGDSADNQQVNETSGRAAARGRSSSTPASRAVSAVRSPGLRADCASHGVQDADVLESGALTTPTGHRASSPPGHTIQASWIARSSRSQAPRAELRHVRLMVRCREHPCPARCARLRQAALHRRAVAGLIGPRRRVMMEPEARSSSRPTPSAGFADRPTYRPHATGAQGDAHGFGFVDRDELAASRGQAAYKFARPLAACG